MKRSEVEALRAVIDMIEDMATAATHVDVNPEFDRGLQQGFKASVTVVRALIDDVNRTTSHDYTVARMLPTRLIVRIHDVARDHGMSVRQVLIRYLIEGLERDSEHA